MTVTVLVTPEALAASELTIEAATYRHLFRARRLPVGATLRLVDGRGTARAGAVTAVDRRRAVVSLLGPVAANEPQLTLEILVAAPRPERAAWLVEKVTELGATAIRFIDTERAIRQPAKVQLARLRRVAASAVEQCHRARVPELSSGHSLADTVERLAACERSWLLDPAGEPGIGVPATASASLLVGPEGGWTEAEGRALAVAGCRSLSLGPRILRVETAAVAGAALLLAGGRVASFDTPRRQGLT